MRYFVSDILTPTAGSPITKLTPVTSARAIAAILLDDRGLDPDSLGRGVTLVVSGLGAVSNSVIGLVGDAILPLDSVVDACDNFRDGQVAVFSDDSKAILSAGIEGALTDDVPVVVVGRKDQIPANLPDFADRWIDLPSKLTVAQVGRVVALVCPL